MKILSLFVCTFFSSLSLLLAQEPIPTYKIPELKNSIYDGVFTRNGLLGTMTYQKSPRAIQIDDGDKALEYLHQLHNEFIQPNTLYKESGPVIETPLSMAQSLQELSLQYWNGVLRIFPTIPSSWKDVSFDNFLTDSAFLVSAKYENGQTKEVTLTAQHDGELKVKTGIKNPEYTITGKGKAVKINDLVYSISLSKGSRITFLNN